jgi:hypothetical protein
MTAKEALDAANDAEPGERFPTLRGALRPARVVPTRTMRA